MTALLITPLPSVALRSGGILPAAPKQRFSLDDMTFSICDSDATAIDGGHLIS